MRASNSRGLNVVVQIIVGTIEAHNASVSSLRAVNMIIGVSLPRPQIATKHEATIAGQHQVEDNNIRLFALQRLPHFVAIRDGVP
jgi:hypothetical protein